jgi:hypothetical protein
MERHPQSISHIARTLPTPNGDLVYPGPRCLDYMEDNYRQGWRDSTAGTTALRGKPHLLDPRGAVNRITYVIIELF